MPAVQNTTTNWQHLHMPYTEYTNSYTVVTTVTLSPVSSPHISKKRWLYTDTTHIHRAITTPCREFLLINSKKENQPRK